MCATCGCGEPEHHHRHEDGPGDVPHVHPHQPSRTVRLEQEVLAKNDRLAERNRSWLAERGVVALNLMSSPGAGKTTLL
ncbi:MAG TPA: hydrogenase accessory protein HypB, partial [Candidatus Binatia bacterium]|nr:hydrogenase accessory protein HypB [Candidatus Binatia bacterium]